MGQRWVDGSLACRTGAIFYVFLKKKLRKKKITPALQANGSWDVHLASPADFFAGADDITKERERAWDRDHRTHSIRTPQSLFPALIITSIKRSNACSAGCRSTEDVVPRML